MSEHSDRRALKRLAKTRRTAKPDGWVEAVIAIHRERDAVRALVRFARALVGTETETEPAPVATSDRREQAEHRPPTRPQARVKMNWPNPYDVITWDQFIRLPCNAEVYQPPAAGCPRGPWANWGFIGPPSYDED